MSNERNCFRISHHATADWDFGNPATILPSQDSERWSDPFAWQLPAFRHLLTTVCLALISSKNKKDGIKNISYLSEVTESLFPEGEKHPNVFNFFSDLIRDRRNLTEDEMLPSLMMILSLAGFCPNLSSCTKCGTNKLDGYYFSFYWGGVICGNCSRNMNTQKLSRNTYEGLLSLTESRCVVADLKDKEKIKKILKDFVRYIKGEENKAGNFV